MECHEWRVRNEEVHSRAGIKRVLASRVDQSVFRRFGHVERMDEYHMAKRMLMAEVHGGQERGRPVAHGTWHHPSCHSQERLQLVSAL